MILFLITYAAGRKIAKLWSETVKPIRVTPTLVILTPSSALPCFWMVSPIRPFLALTTTLHVDHCWSVVPVVIKIKSDPLIASEVDLCGILSGSSPVVKSGESIAHERIPHALRIQTVRVPDQTTMYNGSGRSQKHEQFFRLHLVREEISCCMHQSKKNVNMQSKPLCSLPNKGQMESTWD